MGVDGAYDIGKLDAYFGGFTPMALSDGIATKRQVSEIRGRAQVRRAQLDQAAALEAARASKVREWRDATGVVWLYVVLDDAEVRIERCRAQGGFIYIPEGIEGKPVVALAPDSLAYLAGVKGISCPDSVLSIGLCAFRGNDAMEKVVLPAHLSVFDPGWFQGCVSVESLVLPGQVDRLEPCIFDIPGLRTLEVGAGTQEIAPGTFAKSMLESIKVDEGNPFLSTDGRAVYSRADNVLMALAVPSQTYTIAMGCKAIARKGMSHFECLRTVAVPETLEELGPFAFSRTGITSFSAPASLRRIDEKAFFNCAQLKEVRLNDGLAMVGANAFTGTDICELHVPSSVTKLGNPLAAHTALTYSGENATFSIEKGCLELDEAGGLYRWDDAGKHFTRMVDPSTRSYAVKSGTVSLDDEAFAGHECIEDIHLPDSVTTIGKASFRGCRALVHVNISAGVQCIEDEAFLDTGLVDLHLPAVLEHVGKHAFVTYGAHHGDVPPSLRDVTVEDGNSRFYTAPALLLERKDAACSRVLVCTGSVEVVRIPDEVDEIMPYAFNGLSGITELQISDRIETVGVRGLAVDCPLRRIRIDLMKPVSEHTYFEICFPDTDRGAQQMKLSLSMPDHVDPAIIYEHYDKAIINASSFDAQSSVGLDTYEQAKRIIERLLDPVFLNSVNHSMCDKVLKNNIESICVEIARHDDRKAIDALLDLGYLNVDNLYDVIDRIGTLRDASMTGYLLEVKRIRFQQDAMDFDL